MSTFADDGVVEIGGKNSMIIVGVTILAVFAAMISEKVAPEVAFLYALVIVVMTGILPLKDALSGFANESLITIGSLFLVIAAVEKSYIIEIMARKAFGMDSSPTMGSFRMLVSTFALSSVFNNTPLVAVMIPVVRDWGRVRDVPLSRLLMPLSYSVLAGGLLTMIGTSTSLTVQGLVKEDRGFEFTFLAPGFVALPCGLVVLLYMVVAAPYLLPNKSGLIRELRDHASELVLEVEVMHDSEYTGRELGVMCNTLGISATSVVKIRRLQGVTAEAASADVDIRTTATAGVGQGIELRDVALTAAHGYEAVLGSEAVEVNYAISDEHYVNRTLPAWGSENKVRSRSAGGSVDVADPTAAFPSCRDILNPAVFETVHAGDGELC
jgi:hypothetical protein